MNHNYNPEMSPECQLIISVDFLKMYQLLKQVEN